ncbi:MAG: hypothetical protein QXO16_05835 [Archaeoglobaceae archaeon]
MGDQEIEKEPTRTDGQKVEKTPEVIRIEVKMRTMDAIKLGFGISVGMLLLVLLIFFLMLIMVAPMVLR